MKGIVSKIYALGISVRQFCKLAHVNVITLNHADKGTRKTRRDIEARILNAYKKLKEKK